MVDFIGEMVTPYFKWLGTNLQEPSFWFQPVFYAVHGYVATEMALMMLFRPYEPIFIPGTKIQLPFTPGIFPRGQHKLSIAIANTITEMLLTPSDIKKQAEKLVTEENIYKALDALIDSIGDELRDISHIRDLYHFVDNLVPPLLHKLVNDALVGLEEGDDKDFNNLLDRFFIFTLPRLHLSKDQASWMIDQLFNTLLTTDYLRLLLVDILSDQNIMEIEKQVRHQVKGLQGFLVQFIDIQKGLQGFRDFLLRQPQESNDLIQALMERSEIREKFTEQLMLFSPHNLAAESLEIIRVAIRQIAKNVLVDNREEIAQMLSQLSAEATHTLTNRMIQIDFNQWSERFLPGFKKDLARFINTYLHKQLETLISQALPAISMNSLIVDK
ncbi:MAG: DUF445 family protein, partial [Cyanobacteria bacterium]|nr:DUF445 family protein [Cyanobacteriota bacterium]